MAQMQRGFRGKLEEHFVLSSAIDVSVAVSGVSYDSCCFGVDQNGKLSDDRYMVFYNQTASPEREIVLTATGEHTRYAVNLQKLPAHIQKLVFTASIDGGEVMREVKSLTVTLSQGGASLTLCLSGSDFKDEKAVIAVELYKKEAWRIAAVASGFNGGLSALLKHFGGEEADESDSSSTRASASSGTANAKPSSSSTPAASSPSPSKVSLEKRLEKEAPKLVSLAKPLKVSLEKHRLTETVARVALVLDISGSMSRRYATGVVQEIVNRTVPLAVQFDDDGELDLWYYGTTPQRMKSVNTKNYENAVPEDWKRLMKTLGGRNNEPAVMKLVIDNYLTSKLPAYVIFITDGGVSSESAIKNLLAQASKAPIFWQFIGVGGSNYGILERLDTMRNRFVDNANFFALDDFMSVSAQELYSRMLREFPAWLKEAKRLGVF